MEKRIGNHAFELRESSISFGTGQFPMMITKLDNEGCFVGDALAINMSQVMCLRNDAKASAIGSNVKSHREIINDMTREEARELWSFIDQWMSQWHFEEEDHD